MNIRRKKTFSHDQSKPPKGNLVKNYIGIFQYLILNLNGEVKKSPFKFKMRY